MFTKEHCCREICKRLGLDKDVPLIVSDGHGALGSLGDYGSDDEYQQDSGNEGTQDNQ